MRDEAGDDASGDGAAAPHFETFGCRLNAYETEAMRAAAAEAGVNDAALVVVNTCAVTAEAVRQAQQRIRRLRRERPEARVVVTGCAAQIEPERFAEMTEVDLVLGNREKLERESWARFAEAPPPTDFGLDASEKIRVDDVFAAREAAPHLIDGFGTRARAFVQVQNGCDHRCTFCVIPYGRGASRSVPAGAVVEQVKRLVGAGFREVVLTGVDLTSWGPDLPHGAGGRSLRLGDLVMKILDLVPDLPRLRISSMDNAEADPALWEAIAHAPRLMPHLHLSLQAGADLILKRMKRRHSRAAAIEFCAAAREARPEIAFGADLIAGFPTETEAHFKETLDLVTACGLAYLHVFPYSPRPMTPAAKMPQTPRREVKARAERLRALGRARLAAHLESKVGATAAALMEKPTLGRTECFAEIAFDAPQPVGEIVVAQVTAASAERLTATPLWDAAQHAS